MSKHAPRFSRSQKTWALLCVCAGLAVLLINEPQRMLARHVASVSVGVDGPQLPRLEWVNHTDPAGGFDARVPRFWQRIHRVTPGDPGVTISFESPPSGPEDRFADYLMIDIQPGNRVTILEERATEIVPMRINGRTVLRERIVLSQHPVADTYIDLVAWQLTWRHTGYSVGIYAIGEQREEARIERLLIEFADSFSLPAPPFMVATLLQFLAYRSG